MYPTRDPAEWSGRPPDRDEARRRYRDHAENYDGPTAWANPDRDRVVDLLGLTEGDVVVDVGCGTGLCFDALQDAVGPSGRIIGIEQSDEMLDRARERVEAEGWTNVTLIGASADEADVAEDVDAVLFCFTHDVLRSPKALANILCHLRLGGRVAAVGPMWAPWWAPAMNMAIWYVASEYVTTFEGFSSPWDHLSGFVPGLEIEPQELAGVFFAWGTLD